MKEEFRNLYFAILISSGFTVILEPKITSELRDEPKTFNEALNVCFAEKSYGTMECVNRGALSVLQAWNEDEHMDFGSIHLERAAGQSRDLLDLDYDPKDFANVIKAASRLLERRNFKWDLSSVYPGLLMRVGPTLNGNGLLEFILDERLASINERQIGTGRLLMRQVLLPFLLGIKFNVASLIPLMFGLLVVVSKKAFILSKIALMLVGILGWNSVWSNTGQNPGFLYSNGFHGHHQNTHHHFGDSFNPNQYGYRRYNRLLNQYSPFNQHVIRELVNVYERDKIEPEEPTRTKKKVVWSKDR